jgi:membrane-associated protease RseP (regulator of RpoE activity)
MSTNPVHDERGSLRRSLERWVGSAIVLGATALKWAFVFGKFFAIFVSFALYSALFHSWEFGLGIVLLLFVHEMGHFVEAKRQHVHVTLPTFVPFFGAYVTIRNAHLSPSDNARISLAGPFLGSVGAAVAWAASGFGDAHVLVGLANIGFLMNAFNLQPIGFLDGGSIARAIGQERRGWIRYEHGVPTEAVPPSSDGAWGIGVIYVVLAVLIVVGMIATKQNGAL